MVNNAQIIRAYILMSTIVTLIVYTRHNTVFEYLNTYL